MLEGTTRYLLPSKNHWIIDIEADDLDATVVWVVCVQNAVTREKYSLTDYEQIRQFFADHKHCYFVGHNIIKFDAPTLNRLVGTRIGSGQLVDTLLLSMLYSPSLAGGHSLEAWGERLKVRKSSFSEWDKYSEEMRKYCEQDVEVCTALFLRLTERMRKLNFTDLGAEIEHRAWYIAYKQHKAGFHFDFKRGHELLGELNGLRNRLTDRIRDVFVAQEGPPRRFAKAYRGDGTPTANYLRHVDQYHRVEVNADGSYDAYELVEFNIGSPKQRVEKLLALGWKPDASETTPTGNPRPTIKGELVASLAAFAEESGIEEIRLIAQWMMLNGRINALSDWLDKYDVSTGCIHGNMWLAGSLRFRHDKPNTANIPSVKVNKDGTIKKGLAGAYSYESRDLWTTRDPANRNLVGVDAAGIQLRVLAHYLGDKEYIDTILNGDIHSTNQAITGIRTRDQTKTFTYAVLLGAGDRKVGEICGVSTKEGGGIKRRFIEGVPGLRRLYQRLETEFERTGRITLCDGSRVLVPSKHMVLAYLLQGDESRLMKVASIFVDEAVRKQKVDAFKVGDIHDEWQSDVLIEHTDKFIEICNDSFKRSGEFFSYNIPIECNAKVGKTWAETH